MNPVVTLSKESDSLKKRSKVRRDAVLLFYTTPLTSRSETLVKTFLDRGVETEEITVQLMKTHLRYRISARDSGDYGSATTGQAGTR